MAPFAEEHHFHKQQQRHDDDAPRHVAGSEQPHDQQHCGEREADGTDEAEHREPEDRSGEQRPAEDEVARVEPAALLGASRRASFEQGTLFGGKRRHCIARHIAVGRIVRCDDGLGGGRSGSAEGLLPRDGFLLRPEHLAQLLDDGDRADPGAERASEQHDERDGDRERYDGARDNRFCREHGAQRPDGADERDIRPAQRRNGSDARRGGESDADDEQDDKGDDGAQFARFHDGTPLRFDRFDDDGARVRADADGALFQRYADRLASAAAVALVADDNRAVDVIELEGFVGTGIVAEPAADEVIGQTPIGVDLGDADDGLLGRGPFGQLERFGGACLHAQGRAVVLLGAEVAVRGIEVHLGHAHADDAVLDMRGLDYVMRAHLVAFLAADAGCVHKVLVLASRGSDDRCARGEREAPES